MASTEGYVESDETHNLDLEKRSHRKLVIEACALARFNGKLDGFKAFSPTIEGTVHELVFEWTRNCIPKSTSPADTTALLERWEAQVFAGIKVEYLLRDHLYKLAPSAVKRIFGFPDGPSLEFCEGAARLELQLQFEGSTSAHLCEMIALAKQYPPKCRVLNNK